MISSTTVWFVISIHAPRERSDRTFCYRDQCVNISIHAPRERSDIDGITGETISVISIHAPRERSDTPTLWMTFVGNGFQSTLLVRGATVTLVLYIIASLISIHAPRERSDVRRLTLSVIFTYFNPRSSWEERQISWLPLKLPHRFQSTLLVRGAT